MKIKVIEIPDGPEPEDIRKEWIGIVFIIKNDEISRQCRYSHDKSFLDIGSEVNVYKIPYKRAMQALKRKGREEAYFYFKQKQEKLYHPYFVFYEDVCA